MKKNTYQHAFDACERFFTETGHMPTIEAIKPLVGVNSPSVISSAIKDWKQSLAQTVRKGQGADPGIPAALHDGLQTLWDLALSQAKDVLREKTDAVDVKQTALAAKEQALLAETEQIQQLVSLTEQKYREEIGYLKKERDRLAIENQLTKEELEKLREIAAAADKHNAVLAEEIRQEKEKYRRLESQYDKEHEWALKRIAEEKESYRHHIQNEMARLQSESARNKHALELLQAKAEQLSAQSGHDQGRIAALERELSDEKLKLASSTLNEARLQGEINIKQEKIRLLEKIKRKGRPLLK